jgi:hypothetical protein
MSKPSELHWLSFMNRILPLLSETTGLNWSELYWASLEKYEELDYYHFQTLPFVQNLDSFKSAVVSLGYSSDLAYSQVHILQEEAYAVMSFHKMECRVIRPTAEAIQAFKNTNVNVPLVDIAPPYPHVFIALPRNPGLQINFQYNYPRSKETKLIDLEGLYVTWSPTGKATEYLVKHSDQFRFKRNKHGLIVHNDLAEENDPDVPPTLDMFGDWSCRVFAVARVVNDAGKLTHHASTFFNMRWSNDNKEEAEGAFERFSKTWGVSFDTSPAAHTAQLNINSQLFHLVANLYLYMSQKGDDADTLWVPNKDRERLRSGKSSMNSRRRRRLRQELAKSMVVDEWIVGQKLKIDRSIESIDTNEQLGLEKHASPKTHWRRGHWHGYWTGPMDGERKLVYKMLKPVLIIGVGGKPNYTEISVDKSK